LHDCAEEEGAYLACALQNMSEKKFVVPVFLKIPEILL
jgi:hypothetical protein